MHPECSGSFFHACWKRLCFLCFLLLGCASATLADNWQASIYENAAPGKLVGVDKKRKTFNFYEKKSPLRLRYSYPCVTGQLQGDKQKVNDLRTPEGIYFVEYKIANGLDFKEYGGVAYTLNYPNPVDRLRGKTGHGIWIHSKGFELVPTKGCVAIDLKNIAEIGPLLLPGTPVVVAEELKNVNGSDAGELEKLRSLMKDWSAAWEGRTDKLFDFYNPEAYSLATENFDLFRRNKERLFKILSFIKIYNREIHALEGPGYWVTWSEQLYTASNLSTEGIRRLYWQKDDKGQFRIVGMEWTPRDVGMKAEVQQGRLVAEAPAVTAVDAASEAPVPPRLDMPENAPAPQPESPEKKAEAPGMGERLSASIAALAENLKNIGEPLISGRLPKFQTQAEGGWESVRPLATASKIKDPSQKVEAEAEKSAAVSGDAGKAKAETDVKATQPDTLPARDPDQDLKNLENAVRGWCDAYKARNRSVTAYYDQKNYNRLASLGVPRGPAYNSILQGIHRDLAQPWLEVLVRPSDLELHGPVAKSRTDLMIIAPSGMRQGIQTLWWHKDNEGQYKIVGSEFRPQALGLEANYLENVSGDVSRMVEDWRQAWEGAKIDDYMAHYTPDAVQQGKAGQKHIRRQKEELWQRKKPSQIQLSGLRLALDNRGLRADMNQSYSDSDGGSDRGIKTLLLRYDGSKWLIQREEWTNQQPVTQVSP